MERINGSGRSTARIWIALAGALLMGALGVGLLGAGADASPPAGAAGYGGGSTTPTRGGYGPANGHPVCTQKQGGYQVGCPANVSHVDVSPNKPVAGKGFKVSFKSKSGGAYEVKAINKHGGEATGLERGYTGTGKTTTLKVGKDLKAGKYKVVVTVTTRSTDKAHTSMKVRK